MSLFRVSDLQHVTVADLAGRQGIHCPSWPGEGQPVGFGLAARNAGLCHNNATIPGPRTGEETQSCVWREVESLQSRSDSATQPRVRPGKGSRQLQPRAGTAEPPSGAGNLPHGDSRHRGAGRRCLRGPEPKAQLQSPVTSRSLCFPSCSCRARSRTSFLSCRSFIFRAQEVRRALSWIMCENLSRQMGRVSSRREQS